MKLYILKYHNEIIGYTYDLCAVKALAIFIERNSSEKLCVLVKELSGEIVLNNTNFKTKAHLENLSKYYQRLGYQYYSWKLIQFNRTVLPEIYFSFYSAFETIYRWVLIDELNKDLDDLLK